MNDTFEQQLIRNAERLKGMRVKAERLRISAETLTCGLDVKAGTYTFRMDECRIMAQALNDRAAEEDMAADDQAAIYQKTLREAP